jgi:hypothetical protein
MNWEQKFGAINALAEASLRMRAPGDWYVSQSVEIKEGAVLCSTGGYRSPSPEAAVERHWRNLTQLTPKQDYIVTNAYGEHRKHWLWNGYMWKELPR